MFRFRREIATINIGKGCSLYTSLRVQLPLDGNSALQLRASGSWDAMWHMRSIGSKNKSGQCAKKRVGLHSTRAHFKVYKSYYAHKDLLSEVQISREAVSHRPGISAPEGEVRAPRPA